MRGVDRARGPETITDRLILRAMQREDYARFAEIWAEPEVLRHRVKVPRGPTGRRTAFCAMPAAG